MDALHASNAAQGLQSAGDMNRTHVTDAPWLTLTIILLLTASLANLGRVLCQWPTSQGPTSQGTASTTPRATIATPASSQADDGWRRTARGWEQLDPRQTETTRYRCPIHPMSVTLLLVSASLGGLVLAARPDELTWEGFRQAWRATKQAD